MSDTADKRYAKLERLRTQAAEDLRLPVEHRRVQMLAALRLNHEVQVEKLINGVGNVDPKDLMELTRVIEELSPELPPPEVKVSIVEMKAVEIECKSCKETHTYTVSNKGSDDGSVGKEVPMPAPPPLRSRCCHCGKLNLISTEPFADGGPDGTVTPQTDGSTAPAAPAAANAAPADDLKPPPPLTVIGYRQDVSASATHSAVLSNNEIPPLKKRQPSLCSGPVVSPMSHDPHATVQRQSIGPLNPFSDPNPNRKVN